MLRDVSLILLLDVEAVCTTLAYWITAPSRMRFESSKIKGVLLGDSGYPCKSYLLTQFLRPRTPAEERYNASHVRTRNVVERCFGEWKGMFRALRNSMQISLPTARTAIVEMAVLYNIRHEFGDTNLYEDDEGAKQRAEEDVSPTTEEPSTLVAGSLFRQQFLQQYFT
ncbi:putative nuclease HARBI1 isoform X2 [Cephus cinctus]|uniref:Nuclease HARBI1 isoform X2 n=1 Tax=Cephus cinctus TaxID=211228 RepID=A0AAJ7FFZ9_CEPCN|nr:putative nuclease HARBI1 isoform X2 [Cephus cinctus]